MSVVGVNRFKMSHGKVSIAALHEPPEEDYPIEETCQRVRKRKTRVPVPPDLWEKFKEYRQAHDGRLSGARTAPLNIDAHRRWSGGRNENKPLSCPSTGIKVSSSAGSELQMEKDCLGMKKLSGCFTPVLVGTANRNDFDNSSSETTLYPICDSGVASRSKRKITVKRKADFVYDSISKNLKKRKTDHETESPGSMSAISKESSRVESGYQKRKTAITDSSQITSSMRFQALVRKPVLTPDYMKVKEDESFRADKSRNRRRRKIISANLAGRGGGQTSGAKNVMFQ